MLDLLPKEIKSILPRISEQDGHGDPTVYAVFEFPSSGWVWFVTEGDAYQDDFCFFGYVVGLEREWGYFCLSELELVCVNGFKVCRDRNHVPKPLSECLKEYGFTEN